MNFVSKLKTQPKQLHGSLRLDIVLTGQAVDDSDIKTSLLSQQLGSSSTALLPVEDLTEEAVTLLDSDGLTVDSGDVAIADVDVNSDGKNGVGENSCLHEPGSFDEFIYELDEEQEEEEEEEEAEDEDELLESHEV
jgi:hypothetical protein